MSDTLMISVSGMRGIVGKDLTPELVARHAAALGAWARQRGAPRVVLGRDARTSGPMYARAAIAGIMSVGSDVIDVGMVPTPTVQMAVEHHRAGAGLILTASHNPIEWNALKFIGPDGIFLDGEAGAAVRALAESGPPRQGWDGVGNVIEDRDAIARHLDAVLALPVIDVPAIRRGGVPRGAGLRAGRRWHRHSPTAGTARLPRQRDQPGDRWPVPPCTGADPREPRRTGTTGAGNAGRRSDSRWTRTWTGWPSWMSSAAPSARTTRWPSPCGPCWGRGPRAGGRSPDGGGKPLDQPGC